MKTATAKAGAGFRITDEEKRRVLDMRARGMTMRGIAREMSWPADPQRVHGIIREAERAAALASMDGPPTVGGPLVAKFCAACGQRLPEAKR